MTHRIKTVIKQKIRKHGETKFGAEEVRNTHMFIVGTRGQPVALIVRGGMEHFAELGFANADGGFVPFTERVQLHKEEVAELMATLKETLTVMVENEGAGREQTEEEVRDAEEALRRILERGKRGDSAGAGER